MGTSFSFLPAKLTLKYTVIFMATLLALMSFLFFAKTAIASASYLKNYNSRTAPACGAINCPYGPGLLVKNGTTFTMSCWQDGNWRVSNGQNSNRWFKGRISGIGGLYWVPAPYVMNQTRVGHC